MVGPWLQLTTVMVMPILVVSVSSDKITALGKMMMGLRGNRGSVLMVSALKSSSMSCGTAGRNLSSSSTTWSRWLVRSAFIVGNGMG